MKPTKKRPAPNHPNTRLEIATAMLASIVSHEGCRDVLVGDLATASFAQDDASRALIYADALIRADKETPRAK